MNTLQQRLFLLDTKHSEERKKSDVQKKNLRVFYGWVRLGKIRKKEAISVIFENDRMREERTMKAIAKYQDTVYVRQQTPDEKRDAEGATRMFTEFSVFLSDKRIKGSLQRALQQNSEADRKNVSQKELAEIANKLREAYLESHPDYKEPMLQLNLFDEI
jgi:hypothetical protein